MLYCKKGVSINLLILSLTLFFSSCNFWIENDDPISGKLPPISDQTFPVENCDSDFDVFFESFSCNEEFQKRSLWIPLEYAYLNRKDPSRKKFVTGYLWKKDYTYIDLCLIEENNNFSVENELLKDDLIRCKYLDAENNLFYTEYIFKFDHGCWYLTSITERLY
ncbi:MAG: hypothetical protein Aureis2KO_23840 [Aureisphaera sp.]